MDPTTGKLFGAIGRIEVRPALFPAEADPNYARWYTMQWLAGAGYAFSEGDAPNIEAPGESGLIEVNRKP